VSKKLFVVALAVVAIMALAVAPAFAEGYNTADEAYTVGGGFFTGPHGGYTTTTNKCADCHSTHYASGSYMLLRANSREAACDYCHGGGGGSSTNIMMDNVYKDADDVTLADGIVNTSVVTTDSAVLGTGHTLGYTGIAPADIYPAYTAEDGFACFDCHSPHGNSARILTTFSDPGRALGTSNVVIAPGEPGFIGSVSADGILNAAKEWGIDPVHGNFKWFGDPYTTANRPADDTAGGRLIYRPIFPNGRFLLLKNPHVETNGVTTTEVPDTQVTTLANETATAGVNKYKIDWSEPMGPADGGYGGYQDNDNDNAFLFAPTYVGLDEGVSGVQGGFLSLSEFCTDCHDGTAGASTQPANVWQPTGVSGSTEGTYAVAYSHDAQPRH